MRLSALITMISLTFLGVSPLAHAAGRGGAKPANSCPHEPENSQAGLKGWTGGKTLGDLAFGSENQCLDFNRLRPNGQLKKDAQIDGASLDRYFDNCNFKSKSSFAQLAEINNALNLKGRDVLVDGLFQEIAHRSHRQLACRQSTLAIYGSDAAKRESVNARAQEKFDDVLGEVRALIEMKKKASGAAKADVFNRIDCSGVAWFMCNEMSNEQTKSRKATIESAIAAKISQIPFGYEPDIANALVAMAAKNEFDPQAYANAMAKAQKTYKDLDSYWDGKRTPAGKGAERYCITREFKEEVASGQWSTMDQVLNDLPPSRLRASQRTAVQCYTRSHYRDVPKRASDARHAAIAGATAAAVGLSAVATDGGSLLAITALGLDAVLFADQLDKAIQACTAKDIVASSTGAEVCDAEKAFAREAEQTEKASCGAESAWAVAAAVPIVGVAVVKTVRGVRSARAVATETGASIDRVTDAAAASNVSEEIVVTASTRSMNRAYDDATIAKNFGLADAERRVAMAKLCPPRNSKCVDALMASHTDDVLKTAKPGQVVIRKKQAAASDRLRQAGLSKAEADRVASRCIRSGLCGSTAGSERFISYVNGQGQRVVASVEARLGDGYYVRTADGNTTMLSATEVGTVKQSALSRMMLERVGDPATDGFRTAYARGELHIGENSFVSFVDTASGSRYPGKLVGGNPDGSLILETIDGARRTLSKDDLVKVRFSSTAVEAFRAAPTRVATQAAPTRSVDSIFQSQPSFQVAADAEYISPRKLNFFGQDVRFQVRSTPALRDLAVAEGRIVEFAAGASPQLRPGSYTYLFTRDGKMVVGKLEDTFEIGTKHQNLANGREVVSAGEMRVMPDGKIAYNLESGTYTRSIEEKLGVSRMELQARTSEAMSSFVGGRGRYTDEVLAPATQPNKRTIEMACSDRGFLRLNMFACCQTVGIGCN